MPQQRSRIIRWARTAAVVLVATGALTICAAVAAAEDTADPDTWSRTPAGSSASGSAGGSSALAPRTMARFVVPPQHFASFDNIITHESGWNVFALNPTSGAYGLGQALPAFKMSSHGPDWCCNPMTQIRWAYDYMNERYGGPDGAWAFWQAHGWY